MSNNTSNTTTTHLNGGATRVSFNADDTRDMPDLSSISGSHTGGRVTIRDGASTVESFSHTSVNQADSFAEARANASSILETARNPHGGHATQLSPKSIVLIDGMETDLATAERMGYVQRNVDGNYVEKRQQAPQGSQQGEQQQAPQGDTSGDEIVFPPEAERAINAAVKDVPQYMYDGAVNKILSMGAESLDYRQIADAMNVSEDEAKERVGYVMSRYKVEADKSIAPIVGGDADIFHGWASENDPKAHTLAMRDLVLGQNVSKLKALATKFMRASHPTDAALNNAGFETKVERDAERMIRIEGTWTNLSTAVRNGWV